MITTGAAVCGPRHISNPCDLALSNQERVVTYYEVATNGHGRVDLCTGRLEPRWRRAVHAANPHLSMVKWTFGNVVAMPATEMKRLLMAPGRRADVLVQGRSAHLPSPF
jgi:hypothetical protein